MSRSVLPRPIDNVLRPEEPPLPWLLLGLIYVGMLLFLAQATVLFPVLPLYVIQRWGEQAPVGLVVGAIAIGVLASRPVVGVLLDTWGRKPMLLLGLLLSLGVQPLYALSPTPAVLMLVRLLHGAGLASFATASHTLLADLAPPNRRAALIGYLGVANMLGFGLGPWLGEQWFGGADFSRVLWGCSGLLLVGLLLALPLPARPLPRPTLPQPVLWPEKVTPAIQPKSATVSPLQLMTRFPVREATLCFLMNSILHGGVTTYLPLWTSSSGVFYSTYALGAVGVRLVVGRLGDRLPPRWSIGGALSCTGGAVIGIALAPSWLVAWALLYGMGFGLLFPVLSAVVALTVPASQRGRVYGFFLGGFDLGMALGSAGLGLLLPHLPWSGVLMAVGGLAIGVGLWATYCFRQPLPLVVE